MAEHVAAIPASLRGRGQHARSLVNTRLAMAALLIAVLCGIHLVRPEGFIGSGTYVAVTVGASVVAWVSVYRLGGAVRWWLAVGISLSALADLIYEIYSLVREAESDVSWADPPWIASYLALSIALLLALRRGGRHYRGDVDGFIDMGVIGLVSVLVLWEFFLSDTVSDASVPLFVRVVWASYPILDAALLTLVLRALIERRAQMVTGLFLLVGVALWLFSDFVWMAITPVGLFSASLDVGWMVGAMLVAVACWRVPNYSNDSQLIHEEVPPVGKARIALAIVPFFVPILIYLVSFYVHRDVNPIPLVVATAGFALLAGARTLRLMRVRDAAQADLASSERLYRALAANSSDAVLLLDAEGRIASDCSAFAAMIGRSPDEVRGRYALEFLAVDDVDSRRVLDQIVASPGVMIAHDARLPRRGLGDLWLSGRATNLLADPDVRAIVINVHDITARKQAEQDLLHSAFHDSLTGLANRALFRNRVEHALARRARSGLDPAVIYLDLDGFKNVNDSLGHEAGDRLLREVAVRLVGIVRSGDTVARLGGDEFGVLIEESLDIGIEAEEIARRALEALTESVTLGDAQAVTVSASLGIAFAERESTASSLLRDADVAMYEAKAAGKARWIVYEEKMRDAAVERLRLESDLAHAIERNELRLVYQPVIELDTSTVVGFEALARWDHSELGLVMPDKFILIAEDSGLIVSIGRWVLEQACLTAARWRHTHPTLTMAVNLSARQLASPDICKQVCDALTAANLEPSALVLEMTETALVHDATVAASRLAELRKVGVRLAIDDFGTGYSSLAYLRQFPVDILKIDSSFIRTITDRSRVSPIVRGLLDLGRSLDLEIVAEGIETGAQLEQLRDQHCQMGQGFLFAEPLRDEDAVAMLDAPLLAVAEPSRVRPGRSRPSAVA